ITGKVVNGGDASLTPTITARWSLSSTTLPRASASPGHMCWNPALSMIIASGCFRFSTAPKTRCGTTPASVASSTPSKMTCCSSPIARMCNSQALVKRDSPVDAIYAAHPLELGVGHWFDLIDIFDAWIHDPNVGLSGVEDLAGRPQHQAGEDRNLVRPQHC